MNDRKIKDKLRQFHPKQKPEDWIQMVHLLDKEKDRLSPLYLLIICIFLAFSFGAWKWIQEQQYEPINTHLTFKSDISVLDIRKVQISNIKPIHSNAKTLKNNAKSYNSSSNSFYNYFLQEPTIPSAQTKGQLKQRITKNILKPIPYKKIRSTNSIYMDLTNEADGTFRKAELEAPNRRLLRHSLTLELAYNKRGNQALTQASGSISYGLQYGLHFNPNFSLHTGFSYSKQNTQISDIRYPMNTTIQNENSSAYNVNIIEKSYQVPLYAQIQYPMNHWIPFIQLGATHHFNRHLRYALNEQSRGIGPNLENLETIQEYISQQLPNSNDVTNFILSTTIRIGLQYKWKKRWSIRGYLGYDHYIGHKILDKSIDRFQFGIGAGYVFPHKYMEDEQK